MGQLVGLTHPILIRVFAFECKQVQKGVSVQHSPTVSCYTATFYTHKWTVTQRPE